MGQGVLPGAIIGPWVGAKISVGSIRRRVWFGRRFSPRSLLLAENKNTRCHDGRSHEPGEETDIGTGEWRDEKQLDPRFLRHRPVPSLTSLCLQSRELIRSHRLSSFELRFLLFAAKNILPESNTTTTYLGGRLNGGPHKDRPCSSPQDL